MTFNEKLIVLRKNKGLTQDDFAKAVGVSRQAVYKWENGTSYPEIQKLIEIKALFEISLDNLFDDAFEVAVPEKKRRRKAAAPAEKAAVPVKEAAPVIESEAPKAEEEKVEEAAVAEIADVVVKEEIIDTPVEEKPEEKTEAVNVEKKVEQKVEQTRISDIKGYEGLRRIDVPVAESHRRVEETEDVQEKKIGFFGRLFGRK